MSGTYLLYAVIPMLNLNAGANIVIVTINSVLFGSVIPIISSPLTKRAYELIPDDKRGICSALLGAASLVSVPLGGAIIGLIGDALSVQGYYMVAALGLCVLSIYLAFNKSFNQSEEGLAQTT